MGFIGEIDVRYNKTDNNPSVTFGDSSLYTREPWYKKQAFCKHISYIIFYAHIFLDLYRIENFLCEAPLCKGSSHEAGEGLFLNTNYLFKLPYKSKFQNNDQK